MRRVAISAVIFITMMIICVNSLFKMEHITQELLDKLSLVEQSITAEDYDTAEKISAEFSSMWHSTEEKLVLYIRHTPLDSITTSSEKMCIYIHNKDMTESLAELGSIKAMLKHMYESELPRYNNIF